MEGSPTHENTRSREVPQIERAFLQEVEHAEELAKVIEPGMCMNSSQSTVLFNHFL